ncbi:GSCFA domain-containing protein [Aestuariivivens insulae]|uniref:GSCFA domain-containing protein n=1 Tax=Aestuariivivens insulae TaxID=1621988 RepID=UPI001F57701B|nr:GSCFA domain-containing protein [Aestuariivivens insulae]
MYLQTQIPLTKPTGNLISYGSNVLLLGSCFVEHIGEKLSYYKFQTVQNPFGIVFHPKAIERIVVNAIGQKQYLEEDVFFHNEQWHCFEVHSKLSNPSKEALLNNLNNQVKVAAQELNRASHIIITLGTAWVYRFTKTNTLVANCHKVSQKEFQKELLSIETIKNALHYITDLIKAINPKVTVIFTVSPVRHLKDGFIENTQSKAHLIAAIHQFLNLQSVSVDRNLHYFPSYEIMMDELRDYRFYAEDMVHPNTIAVNYIWEKFQSVWMSGEASKIMKQVDGIQKGLQHKPFNPNSEAHQQFLQQLEVQKKELQQKFTHISF